MEITPIVTNVPHPLDTDNLEQIITDSPKQFAAGLDAAAAVPLPNGPFDRLLVAGMGGSWMAAQLVSDAGLTTIPIDIHRTYGLPRIFGGQPLVLTSSFSGNTEETLSAYAAAREAGYAVIGMAAGGELQKRCARDGMPFMRVPANPPSMQPRSATGYGVGMLTRLLARLGHAAPNAVAEVSGLEDRLLRRMETVRAAGERIAGELATVTPVIYASNELANVARIWKIKMNENAKTPAFWNVFPELNHNEMVGWTKPHGAFHLLILENPDDHPRVLKRMEITAALLRKNGIAATLVRIEGGTQLEKIFSALLLGDWVSYRLALTLGVNPSPVAMVEDFKKRLAA